MNCDQYARQTYVQVNALVGDTLEAMAELTAFGAEMPSRFADSAAWLAAQDAIEQAVASGDEAKVRFTCNDYLARARANCEAVLAKMLQEARAKHSERTSTNENTGADSGGATQGGTA